jgi:diguanylate cyclase (GGDEF)-like protein/PAS domain S-box-containing protein
VPDPRSGQESRICMKNRVEPAGFRDRRGESPDPPDPAVLLDGVLDTIDQALILTDELGRILKINALAERLWGYRAARVEGKSLRYLLGEQVEIASLDEGDDSDRDSTRPRERALEIRTAGGETVPVLLRTAARERGGRRFFIVAVRDIHTLAIARLRLRQLKKAVDTMQLGVTITDNEQRILYVNPAEAEMHGYRPEELLGRESTIFAPPELWQPMSKAKLRGVRSWRRDSVNVRKDGSRFPVEILSDVVTDEKGEPAGVVSICQDVTKRKQTEEALRRSEERYALAARGANDGIWDWDLESGRLFFSARWKEMLGCGDDEIGDELDDWLGRVHPEDREHLDEALDRHLQTDLGHFESEHRLRHADGSYRLVLCRGLAVRDETGTPLRMAGSITDITDRKAHDPLTGLPNRALFLDRLRGALARTQRRPEDLTVVLFLDIDRFKLINDSLGHLVGDQLLVSVARRIEASLRPADTLARLGGDEMTVLLEEIHEIEHALVVANRIHDRLQLPFHVGDRELYVSVSIGISPSVTGLEDPTDLLRSADSAMYEAKAQGRGRTVLFDQEMRRRAASQLQLETDLRQAVQSRQLEVHYQPIVSLTGNRLTGFEALLRWRHPERGLLMPRDFVPTAEDTGLIIALGRWILREACQQLQRWRREFPAAADLQIHVNLSAKQFGSPDLVLHVEHALQTSGLEPRRLTLEVSEAILIADVDMAGETVDRLQEIGVRVCIDDFGTGYSALSYLRTLHVSGLKIDRSFVHQIDGGGRNVELVQAIIRLAQDLQIDVVAEGVETASELEILKNLACSRFQGYWHSRPAAAAEMRSLLQTLGD